MTRTFSEDDVTTIISRLTPARLRHFVEVAHVRPLQHEGRCLFRQIDIARLELICDLSDDLGLEEDALALVLSLIDQLHLARQERGLMLRALNGLPADLRDRVIRSFAEATS